MTEAMMELDQKIVGVWFMRTAQSQDWVCAVREIEPDRKYEIVCLFRYHAAEESSDPFDGKDTKSWYKATGSGTRAYVIAAVRMVAHIMFEAGALEEPYELLNEGDFEAFKKKFFDAPFVFARMKAKPK